MKEERILFEKPDVQALREEHLCFDMHVHSNHSDGFNKVPFILKKAKKLGIGIALSDHNTISGCLQAKQQHEVPVILSMEVNSYDGPHILFYFYDEKEYIHFYEKHIKPFGTKDPNSRIHKTLAELHDASKQYNVVTSLAHPNGILWQNIMKSARKNEDHWRIMREISAMEAINGIQMQTSNKSAAALADALEKGITGGSDAHTILSLGDVLTCAKADSIEDFLDSIKKKKTIVIGKESTNHKRVLSQFSIVQKHTSYAGALVKERIPQFFSFASKRQEKQG